MKLLVRTQIVAILVALFWVSYLTILAFLDQPDRALQYINSFVFGFAILLAIIYFLLTKYLLGRNWIVVPLVLIPYYLVYKPILEKLLLSLISKNYGMIIKFLALSTGTTHLLAMILGIVLAILFTRPQFKS